MIDIVFDDGWYKIDTIAIDAVVRETHRFAGEVTEHPVETGSNLSDHYRQAPRGIELEGVITDTPSRIPGSHNSGAQLVQQTFEIPTELFGMRLGPIPISIAGIPRQGSVTTFSTTMERVKSTWEEFEAIFAEQRIITIVTSLRVYADMALRELEVDRKPGSYHFTAFAQQLRTATSGTSQAAIPKVIRAVPKVQKGNQQPKPVTAPTERSTLRAAIKAATRP